MALIVWSTRSERAGPKDGAPRCRSHPGVDDHFNDGQGTQLPRVSLDAGGTYSSTLSPHRGSLQLRSSRDCNHRISGVVSFAEAPATASGGGSESQNVWGGHPSAREAQPAAPRSSTKQRSFDIPRAATPHVDRHPHHHSSSSPAAAARHAAADAPRACSGSAPGGPGWAVDTIDNSVLLSIDLGLASGRMSAVEATELLASYGCDVQELLAAEMAAAEEEGAGMERERERQAEEEEEEQEEQEDAAPGKRPSHEREAQEAFRMLLAA
ncbi:hypothetical protein HXX76_006439 [Chlamydomonas incerta]|uniref:Uncharacterized protein n=1 Tax=Chlamydomonas incerta TaxID=51695 RepID=A0A835TDP7_CHLIN|nr:hypothetical protein HXX76_006439 [Chlamydomonas incerta]|eukprot:KAG2436920.1 hypothetical protein HXX76_006439 [Chlamydomonas incerta]